MKRTLICIVGARPNYMKMAPVVKALKRQDRFSVKLVHTGQHYDPSMNSSFFDDLDLPPPDINLNVGSGSHAQQTGEIMRRFEPVLDDSPDPVVIVPGDVNSTIACALVAAKKNAPVVHVEAGLRSYDRSMPEEINRVLTDQISDLLFTTERSALDNLKREGIDPNRVVFVGNLMIDSLLLHLPRAAPPAETVGDKGRLTDGDFGLVTMHRPSNVDDPAVLKRLLETLRRISDRLPLVFPMHPRTLARIEALGLQDIMGTDRIARIGPVGYLQMLGLTRRAKIVLTDSGGLQEETTVLGIPCLTLRSNTERPITVTEGTNRLVGTEPDSILAACDEILTTGGKAGRVPEFWDGRASERIAETLIERLSRP